MKRFLYQEIECCGDCPYYQSQSQDYGMDWDCFHDDMESELDCLFQFRKEIHADCPLPREFNIKMVIEEEMNNLGWYRSNNGK
jgi:hypothetical protein